MSGNFPNFLYFCTSCSDGNKHPDTAMTVLGIRTSVGSATKTLLQQPMSYPHTPHSSTCHNSTTPKPTSPSRVHAAQRSSPINALLVHLCIKLSNPDTTSPTSRTRIVLCLRVSDSAPDVICLNYPVHKLPIDVTACVNQIDSNSPFPSHDHPFS